MKSLRACRGADVSIGHDASATVFLRGAEVGVFNQRVVVLGKTFGGVLSHCALQGVRTVGGPQAGFSYMAKW